MRLKNGLILLIAKNDRKLRIEVGYGLEATIPDATAKWIIDEQIVPEFKNSEFNKGINIGVDHLIALVTGNSTVEQIKVSSQKKKDSKKRKDNFLTFLLIIAIAGSGFIATFRKKSLIFAIALTVVLLFLDF